MKKYKSLFFAALITISVSVPTFAGDIIPSYKDCDSVIVDKIKGWQSDGIKNGAIASKLVEWGKTGKTYDTCIVTTQNNRTTGEP